MNYCHEKLLSLFRRYRLYSLYILNHINKKLHTFIITNQTITLVGKQYKDSAYICSYTKMCKMDRGSLVTALIYIGHRGEILEVANTVT